MLTKDAALAALLDYCKLNRQFLKGVKYQFSCMEPDGVIVYLFEIIADKGIETLAVFSDDNGINIEDL